MPKRGSDITRSRAGKGGTGLVGPAAGQAPARGVTFASVRRLLLALPEVEEGPCYGTPGFRVRRRFLARLRDDGATLVVKCGDDERDFRMQADPQAFFITDHYRGYPAVLLRLARVAPRDLREVVVEAWRRNAPKRLVATQAEAVAIRKLSARRPRRARR